MLVFISVSVKGQVYQVMTQYGYETKRMNFDSTLQIPTVCGVPTLKSVVLPTKKAAIAFDSCNNRFYTYNPKTQTWSQVSGGADTTSLSNRINTKIDSIKRSTDSVFAKINGTWYYQFKDSVGTFTTPNLQQVTDAGATTTNEITAAAFNVGEFLSDNNSTRIDASQVLSADLINDISIGYSVNHFTLGNLSGSSQNIYGIFPMTYYDSLMLPVNDPVKDTLATLRDVRGVNVTTGLGSVYDTAGVLLARVRNSEATTLNRGEVVYIYGSTGNVASVKRANNKQDSTSSKTFGVVKNNIAAGDTGVIVTQGQIDKLNLGSFSEGDILWLDSVDGQFTKTKPTAPYHQVFLGVVERANNGNGLAYIKVQNGYELGELHNVSVNGVANNDVLMYESSTQLWKNKPVNAVSSLNGLTANTQTFATGTSGSDFNISSTTSTHTFNLPTASGTNRGALSSADWTTLMNQNVLTAYQLLGSTIKGVTLTASDFKPTATTALSSGVLYLFPVYIPITTTVTGVKFMQGVQGVYSATNYNGVGLYSVSSGTLTLQASTTNDGNFWKGTANTWQTKPFSSTYSAAAGVYYIGVLYSGSQTTAPTISVSQPSSGNNLPLLDFTNGNKLSSTLNAQTSLPTPQAMSATSVNNTMWAVYIY